jgi:hypothetical protein
LKYDESNGLFAILSKECYTKLLQNIILLDKGSSVFSDYIWESELDNNNSFIAHSTAQTLQYNIMNLK